MLHEAVDLCDTARMQDTPKRNDDEYVREGGPVR